MNLTSFFTQHFGGASFYHSHSETPDAKRFERHCHNNYELIYVVKGKGKYVVESAEYPLLPNTVLLLRPYEYHYVCPQSDSAYERYVFHFSSNLFLDAADRLEMTNQNKTGGAGIYHPHRPLSASYAQRDTQLPSLRAYRAALPC